MKGASQWNHKPYRPFDQADEAEKPFVCRIAPYRNGFEAEWMDNGSTDDHILQYRKMESYEPWTEMNCIGNSVKVECIENYADYEFRVVRKHESDIGSAVRYVRTGETVGTVVNYLHPADEIYAFSGRALCSPSLVKLPDGALLASMDLYAPDVTPQNLTLIFRSDDSGETWHYLTDLFPCYWGTLFLHRGKLFMFSTETEYGNVLVSESKDEGKTWSVPTVLFYGSGLFKASGWQHTPSAFTEHQGRLYTSIDYGAWANGGHGICLLSIDADADLLNAENWCVSSPVRYDPTWQGAPKGSSGGLLEGNIVVGPDGELYDLLRLQINDCVPNHGLAVALKGNYHDPEVKLKFDSFVEIPCGSNSKTHIIRDEVSGQYIGIGNICTDSSTPGQRNVLAMVSSRDMVHWEVAKNLLDYRHMDAGKVGFQYIFFLIDGDDIIYLSRTSINNAHNYHDANYQTFHRIKNFRNFL